MPLRLFLAALPELVLPELVLPELVLPAPLWLVQLPPGQLLPVPLWPVLPTLL